MKCLNDVCLFTVDGREKNNLIYDKINNILFHCNSEIKFKYNLHLTNSIDEDLTFTEKNGVQIYSLKIPQLSYYTYNKFCVENLYHILQKIDCSHFLMIQDDGFIINPNLWSDDFLAYDYIGAPWINNEDEPKFGWVETYGMKTSVGNGGFSLRSKKFIEISSKLRYNSTANEDVFLCAVMHDYFTEHGLKFAPIDIAAIFSLETKTRQYNSLEKCFGFHGKHNLAEVKKIFDERNIKNVM